MLDEWMFSWIDKEKVDHLLPRTPVSLYGMQIGSSQHPHTVVGRLHQKDAKLMQTLQEHGGLSLQLHCSRRHASKRADLSLRLSVIIYGHDKLAGELSSFLENSEPFLQRELFLQDPVGCDRNVRYRNAQSLWAQDSTLIKMTQELFLNDRPIVQAVAKQADLLADLESPYDLPEAATPSLLKTKLYRHQRQALAFMRRRELGWDFSGQQDFWQSQDDNHEGIMYLNTVTGRRTPHRPDDFRGGILADQMGLGKSLSILALVASDKDGLQENASAYSRLQRVDATLIVVRAPRKSRRYH